MKIKLIKSGFCETVGKHYKKKFYEYGMYTKEELIKRSKEHSLKVKEILGIRANAVKEGNEKNKFFPFPKFVIPTIPKNEINEVSKIHFDENIIDIVYKHNGNIQIYVDVNIGDEPVQEEVKTVEKSGPAILIAEPKKAGRPKKDE